MAQQTGEGQPDRFDKIQYSDLSHESSWIQLGKGSFGCVYKGEYLGIEVAIKEVLPSTDYDVEKYLQREIALMQQARHPNIVQYLGLSLAPPSQDSELPEHPRILIISEFLPRGNLRQYILDRTLPLPWRLRISFAVDIARALAYLHSNNCMHRDLKGENLLVTGNGRLKACDFGLARVAPGGGKEDEAWRRLTYCGTDGYMSPEILLGETFDLKTDIFSLGVLFVELAARRLASNHTFVRQLPDYGMSHEEVWASVSSNCPRSFVELALECCDIDPGKRPDAKAVLQRLRGIEKEVLDLDARGLGDVDAHTRGGSTRRPGAVAVNVGSISYAGATRHSEEHRRGPAGRSARPSAPRLPSFEGQVNLRLGSSFVGGSAPTATVLSASIPSSTGVGPARLRQATSSDDEDSEALLALAEVDVPIDTLDAPGQAANLTRADHRTDGFEEDSDYSTSVVRSSQLGRGKNQLGAMPYGRLASSSGSNLPGMYRGDTHDSDGDSDLPDLPRSWIATSARAIEDLAEDRGTATVIAPRPKQGLSVLSVAQDAQGAESFLTARTSTLSVAAAVVGHPDAEADETIALADADTGEISPEQESEEAEDVFHSAIQGAPVSAEELTPDAPHRFSLIKPGLQRVLGSFAPVYSPPYPTTGYPLGTQQSRRASWDFAVRLEAALIPGPAYSAGPQLKGRCGLCEKRFGIMKAYLSCDDCGFSCHIKCSDLIPPNCPSSPFSPASTSLPSSPTLPSVGTGETPAKPSRPAPPAPAAAASVVREASQERRSGSKLTKRPRGTTGPKSATPLAQVNA